MIADFTPGEPIDLRPPEREAEKPTGDFEWKAAKVVARLTGERVVIQDDGSKQAIPDLRIDYADRQPAYVEVVIYIDNGYAAMQSEILKRAKSMPAIRRWQIRISGTANVRDLRPELLQTLGNLDTRPDQQEVQRLQRLGVTDIAGPWTPSPGRPGCIKLLPEGISGHAAMTWEPFVTWIAMFLASDHMKSHRDKLAATCAAERHIFVGASFTTPAEVYFALRPDGRPELPDSNPILPAEITHLWVWSVPGMERCLAWFPDSGWFEPMDRWATE